MLTVSKTDESIKALPDFLGFLFPAKKLPKKEPFSEVFDSTLIGLLLVDKEGVW
jgi:hypothetical protein